MVSHCKLCTYCKIDIIPNFIPRYGHEHFVGSLCPILNSSHFPPSVASGGNDKLIQIWDVESGASLYTLIGHEDSVVALSVNAQGELISGSWDKTVRIWRGAECKAVLKGHSHSVWSVLGLPNSDIVSASADKTIIVWRNNSQFTVLKSHQDCVRGLCLLPSLEGGFASCGNDGLVIIWNNLYQSVLQYTAHDSFIYSISFLKSTSELITASEDKSIKVWQGGVCTQTIKHPSTVWCVSVVGDEIITGCSDGVARVFSRSRIASEDKLQAYTKLIESSTTLSTGETVGNIDINKLPPLQALEIPGKKNGENKIVRNGNKAEAYSWDSAQSQWVQIGEVVAQPPSESNTLHGKQYDHIFDVDVGDGTIRKLGYNNHENPFMAAQEFLWKEELDQGWLDQVAQFIINNTKNFTLGESSSQSSSQEASNPDPFTGGNRYIPGNQSTSSGSKGADPFTGGNRYVPDQNSSNTTASTARAHFPITSPLVFDTANNNAILNKILEFNKEVDSKYSEQEEAHIKDIFVRLGNSPNFNEEDVIVIVKSILNWPEKNRFPSLDLLRLIVLHNITNLSTNIIEIAISKGLQSSVAANQMLALRLLANLFNNNVYSNELYKNSPLVLNLSASLVTSDNKNIRLALVTLLLK